MPGRMATAMGPETLQEAIMPKNPSDWPQSGPIDLAVHDLPHASSSTEWWYINGHLTTVTGKQLSIFASFFRIVSGQDPQTKNPVHAHSVTWAISDPSNQRYVSQSLVDKDAPRLGKIRLERGEGSRDPRLQRALREVLDKGQVPRPDRLFVHDPHVSLQQLDLNFDDQSLRKRDDGSYELSVRHEHLSYGFDVVLQPLVAPARHGEDGVVRGVSGEDMFYYFIPRCTLTGSVTLPGGVETIAQGSGWYDHEFGTHLSEQTVQEKAGNIGWNWCGVQLADGSAISAYALIDEDTLESRGNWAIVVDAAGQQHRYDDMTLEATASWSSTRTFQEYPTQWRLHVPAAGIDLTLKAAFDDQEFVTLISKPAFWEGRVDVLGRFGNSDVTGLGYVERSGMVAMNDMDGFFAAVGREVRKSVNEILPRNPTWEQTRDMIASKDRPQYMDGVEVNQLARTMVDPVRDITDRGGKSWRSYAALACCDVVGGDSRTYVQWLAMPELMHVGSLIVDDVQDKSTVRRGGPTTHLVHGEALAINAGTACYFMGQRLLFSQDVSPHNRLRLYDLYFESLRAGHAGQALDIGGHDHVMADVVASGDGALLERRVLAVHRLKTAVPAASLARMGALVGGGSEAQIEGVGLFFEALGLAFQIIDDVLNLRGFRGDLKDRGEDIAHGKVTLPIAKAMSRMSLEERQKLWATVESKTSDRSLIEATIADLERHGAIQACEDEARAMVEQAWAQLEPLVLDSLPKLLLRAFGWYVLERHY